MKSKSNKSPEQQAAIASVKETRARDAALAMREYQLEIVATAARTERLRALRLSRDRAAVAATGREAKTVGKTTKAKRPVGEASKAG